MKPPATTGNLGEISCWKRERRDSLDTKYRRTGYYVKAMIEPAFSGQNVMHDVSMNVGEAEVSSLETVGQPLVVDP